MHIRGLAREVLGFVVLLLAWVCSGPAAAQELAPRAYWPAPVGTQLLLLGYQFSTGDIVTDPTLPVSGVQSDINYLSMGYQHFGDFLGRTASLQLTTSHIWGKTEGLLEGDYIDRNLSGTADMRLRASVNLLGAPALDAAGMQELRANPRTIVGVSLTASLPTGTYDGKKVLNEGTNRWALKPALGIIWPVRPRWLLEAELGVWLFGDNKDFLGGTREQDPIWTGELHLVRRFRPGAWVSLDLNRYQGGETRVDGGVKKSLQRNSRAGATLVLPVGRGRGLRLAYSRGVATRAGGDYELYTVNYVLVWR